MKIPQVLGVDIGGSHVTAGLVDIETGQLAKASLVRSAVDSCGTKEEILTAWCEVIVKAFGGHVTQESRIGIAIPGPFDYENGISLIREQNKFNALFQVNVKDELSHKLGISPSAVKFINDAAGFMQGEIFSGAAKGAQNAIGITLGTGLGSSIAHNGNAVDAALWNSDFKEGIAEDYLSTRWFIKRYQELSGQQISGVKELVPLVGNDQSASSVFTEFGNNLAEFLSPLIIRNGAEKIVLGGNIAKAYEFFDQTLKATLADLKTPIDIQITKLNEHAALIGAASVWSLVANAV